MKGAIVGILDNLRQTNVNCLLITTTNPDLFEDEKNDILKILFNSFNYE